MRHTVSITPRLGFCVLLILGGCSLNRGASPAQHYVLGGALSQPGSPAPRQPGDIVLGIRRLQLAPYLQSNSVVVRQGDRAQELNLSEFHRWSEPLGEGITRSVAAYITSGGSVRVVDVAPWPAGAEHDYLVELHVLRFEGLVPAEAAPAEGEAHVLATWAIVRADDGEVLARGTSEFREAGWRIGDYPGLVSLLDAGVSALAADLMSSLERLAAQ